MPTESIAHIVDFECDKDSCYSLSVEPRGSSYSLLLEGGSGIVADIPFSGNSVVVFIGVGDDGIVTTVKMDGWKFVLECTYSPVPVSIVHAVDGGGERNIEVRTSSTPVATFYDMSQISEVLIFPAAPAGLGYMAVTEIATEDRGPVFVGRADIQSAELPGNVVRIA